MILKLNNRRKKNILIVADTPNWAYHHIALFIKKKLSLDFNIYIDFTCLYETSGFRQKINNFKLNLKYCNKRLDKKYDLVVLLGFYFFHKEKIPYNFKYLAKGIYTSTFPPQGTDADSWDLNKEAFLQKYFNNCHLIIAGSHDICSFYKNDYIPIRYCNAPPIAETKYTENKVLSSNQSTLTIGWTGNPNRNFKGYYDIILPAIEKLQEKYKDNIVFKTRFKGSIDTLVSFYSDIDLVLIASNGDAGPSLFWEACLSDIPSIATSNGWPSEVIEHNKNGIICERTPEAFYTWIEYLFHNRDLLSSFSRRIKQDAIEKLGSEISIKRWKDALNEIIN
ncbi:MAG: glycosyltransferase [Marinilabiliaceae bacterium]|nr:glycosyltransferase [Marinilabiliaceae bacterium]MBN2821058.1 glycosyltransferase [Bacteroidales bacterium]